MEAFPFMRLVTARPGGERAGILIVKTTWTIGEDRQPVLAEEQQPIRTGDVWASGASPESSPVLLEHELVPRKPRTDVIVLADAWAPDGVPAPAFEVRIGIGSNQRVLRVTGPRRARFQGRDCPTNPASGTPPIFGEPDPVARVPMDWFHAYGGEAVLRPSVDAEPVRLRSPGNPFGKGFCVQHTREAIDGLELPQIEDPDRLLTPASLVQDPGRPEAHPEPVGVGCVGRGWVPRVAFAGVVPGDEDRMREALKAQAEALDPVQDAAAIALLEGMSLEPMDMRFHQCAAPGMQFPVLQGGEAVALRNLTRTGYLAFNLPQPLPTATVLGRFVPLVLDTVVVDVRGGRLELTQRGQIAIASDLEAQEFVSGPVGMRRD